MTRLSTPHLLLPPTPRSVVLGELAVAAGIAGQPVTLMYQDYAGPALCEIWKYLMRGRAARGRPRSHPSRRTAFWRTCR